jgi:hypothetical protein
LSFPCHGTTTFRKLGLGSGDWLPGLCWLLIVAVIALAMVERWRSRRTAAIRV